MNFGGPLVSWKSNKQEIISRSSTEAEFRSLASTVAEITWLIWLFKELRVKVAIPVKVFYDSKAVIQIEAHLVFHERTKV